MQQDLPIFETDEEALLAAVQHAGGAKAMGCKLWPDVSPDTAQRKLLDALNGNRPERLRPSQVRLVLREAHARGYHAAAQWFMGEAGYSVAVIEPAAQADRAIEAVNTATETLAKALAMLERSQRSQIVRVAA